MKIESMWGNLKSNPFHYSSNSEDARSNIHYLTWGNKNNYDGLLDSLFTHALHPEENQDVVEELNREFFDHWFTRINPKWGSKQGYPISNVLALYFIARDFVAPVKIAFVLDILKEFQGKERYVHFLARDAYSEFKIATNVFRRKPEMFKRPELLNYVPISVKLMRRMEDKSYVDLLKCYLDQFGFGRVGRHGIVDIGFTGEIPDRLSKLYQDENFLSRFLMLDIDDKLMINRPVMKHARGFAFDSQTRQGYQLNTSSVRNNLFKRAMEDTFGGLSTSSTNLKVGNANITSTATRYLESWDCVKRKVAQIAINHAIQIFLPSSDNHFHPQALTETHVKTALLSNLNQLFIFYKEIVQMEGIDAVFANHEPTN